MKRTIRVCAIVMILGAGFTAFADENETPLTWERLPDLPHAVAGPFAGVVVDAKDESSVLIVAGGRSTSEGGEVIWHDDILVLEAGATSWRTGWTLPRPTAHGVCVSTPDGLVCIGGTDGTRHYDDVYLLAWSNGDIDIVELPRLPRPCAHAGGAILGKTVYVAGGQESPGSENGLQTFWSLDLSKPDADRAWENIEPWPGPVRISPVAVAQDGAFILASGVDLTDAYKYTPGRGWRPIASLSAPVAAVPAVAVGGTHVLVFGNRVHAYETVTDTWRVLDTMPGSVTEATALRWSLRVSEIDVSAIVIPGGRDRQGQESAAVLQTTAERRQSPFHLLDYLALVVYLVTLVGMGFYFSRRGKTTEDFFLAGRRIPWWAATLSIFSTYLSAVTFMAIPAKAYATDWVSILMNLGIILVAPVTVLCFLPFYRRLNLTSIYEYLELRFGPVLRMYGSLSFVVFQLGRMGIFLLLPSLALATVTGFDVYACIIVMGLLCTLYTVLGGIEAVVWTDVIQSFVLIGGGLLCVVVVFAGVDLGLGGMFDLAASHDKFHVFNMRGGLNSTVFWVVIVGGFFTQLVPFTSDQALVQRFLTTPTERSAARAVWIHALMVIPASLLFFGLGTVLFIFYKTRPELLQPAAESNDIILPWFVATQLPAGLAGLVIAGLFAATMSSVDSSMNSVATSLVTDFYRKLRPESTDRTRLKLARVLTVIVGVLGTLSAIFVSNMDAKSLWDLILMFAGLLGSSLTGVFVLGVFTRRASAGGTAVGVVVSIAVLAVVRSMEPAPVHGYLYAAVGVLTCVTVGYLASFLLPGPQRSREGLTLATIKKQDQQP